MADFMDKMRNGLNKGVATISTGSKNAVEKTKINSIINNLKNEKRQMCATMGLKVYDACKQNPDADLPWTEMVSFYNAISQCDEQIDAQKRRIENLDAELSRVMGSSGNNTQTICVCGYANASGSRFCAKCGKELQSFDNM